MKFHLILCVPNPKMHGLYGHIEVIQSIEWGLKELGYTVTSALNSFEAESVNIVFGAQVLPINFLEQLPNNTIIYNFEQMRGVSLSDIRPEIKYCANKFHIWEYSPANLPIWESLGAKKIQLVSVGYAPVLTKIPKPANPCIDVLIYGLTGNKRLDVFHRLSTAGLKVVFACGLYGAARDGLISQSKIVLNINLYDYARIFEIVRVSYLLANKKVVVGLLDPKTYIDPDILDSVKITTLENVVDCCNLLLEDEQERSLLEQKGFNNFSKRDIRTILKTALTEAAQSS